MDRIEVSTRLEDIYKRLHEVPGQTDGRPIQRHPKFMAALVLVKKLINDLEAPDTEDCPCTHVRQ